MSNLPGIFATVAPWVQHYGYAAVAGCVLLENVGLLVPGEAVLVTAALLAGTSGLSLPAIAAVAFGAAAVGDNLGYLLGRVGGRPLVLRLGARVGLTHERLSKVERFFDRRGMAVVLFARFLPVLRHGNGIAAGTSGMRWRQFLAANVTGAALWAGAWTAVGSAGASHLDRVASILGAGPPVLVALVALLAVAVVVRRNRRRTRHRRAAATERAFEPLI